jgi:hypothetical protein
VLQRRRRTRRTRHRLDPAVLDGFHPEALVVWIRPREVAVGEEAAHDVPAGELEVLVVAHDAGLECSVV